MRQPEAPRTLPFHCPGEQAFGASEVTPGRPPVNQRSQVDTGLLCRGLGVRREGHVLRGSDREQEAWLLILGRGQARQDLSPDWVCSLP